MRRALWPLALAVATAAFGAAEPAGAHEPDTHGLGSRSSAMGGAVAADATDFSASYYNPAVLVSVPGVELSIGYVAVANRLAIDGADNDVDPVHGLVGGIVAPGKILGIPFAFGIATHLPDDGLSRIRALKQETPRWVLYEDRTSILFLAANLAVRPLPFLEIGGGVAFLAATRGRFAISGKADVLKPYDSELRHEVDADLTTERYPQAGLRVLLGKWGAVALAYRGESKLKLGITAHLEGDVTFAGVDVPLLYDLETRTITAFLPRQVVLGLSLWKIEHLHVNLDLTWLNWAAYESPTARTLAHLEAHPPPSAPIQLPADPAPVEVVPPAFDNRLVPRLGVEYVLPAGGPMRRPAGRDEDHRMIEVPLRVGYVFERSPVPPQTGATNFVDADRHTLTAGAGIAVNAPFAELPGSLHFDVHGELSLLPERVTLKDSAADFVGDYRASGTMFGGGATLGIVF